jgi:hypothetical protein
LTRNSDASADHPDSSVHSEGQSEHRGGKLPMVTSALSKQLRFPSQGSDRQLPDETSVSEGVSVQAETAVSTEQGIRHHVIRPDGTEVRFRSAIQEASRGHTRRPVEARRVQLVNRRMRFFDWTTPSFEQEEVSLRGRVRAWEQDEKQKMEQERLVKQGNRRNLDHFKRGDHGTEDASSDQAAENGHSEGIEGIVRNRLNEKRRWDQVGDGAEITRRLTPGDRKDEMLGEVTHDRDLEESRSSLEIDHQ